VAAAMLAGALATTAPTLTAQRIDSARVGVRHRRPPTPDSILVGTRPRIRPRTAFLRSLVFPGWGQTSLDRGGAAGLFFLIETISATMVIKSKRDLTRAQHARGDSLFIGWKADSLGHTTLRYDSLARDSLPIPMYQRNWLVDRIQPRQQHFEDWLAILIFNHFFAGADAFVAAHLSDLPPRVSIRRERDGVVVSARVAW
jgi:hypothetical protein